MALLLQIKRSIYNLIMKGKKEKVKQIAPYMYIDVIEGEVLKVHV